MSSLKQTFKNNIILGSNKYNLSSEKIGEVLDVNKKASTCTVMYKNLEGILVTNPNVTFKKSSLKGFLGGSFKKGDYVELQEVGNTVRITGKAENNITEEQQATSDIYSGGSDFGGLIF